MKISDEDRDFIIKNIPGGADLIDADQVDDLLDALDGFMTERGYEPPTFQELNQEGRQAERILDRIYYNN